MQHFPTVTALTAGFLIILQMVLMFITASARGKYKQGLGDGGKPQLLARIRSHGNLAENAPIVLIVLGLLETAGANTMALTIGAAAFVIARILHPIGLAINSGSNAPRFIGAVGTVMIGIFGGAYLIYTALTMS